MKTGSIYIIKNRVNDKVYIGQTTMTVHERFMCHLKPSTEKRNINRKLYNAIRKYGKENFYVEILENEVNLEEIDDKEIYYIDKYNSCQKGYNSTNGGDGRVINKLNNEEEILKLAKSGVGAKELAKKFSVHEATILRTLHKLGFYYYKPISKKVLSELIDKGYSNAEIANELKVDKATISRVREKHSLKAYKKKVSYRKNFDIEGFKSDYENGMNRAELCEKYNITNTTMNRLSTKYNLTNKAAIKAHQEKEQIDAELVRLKNNGASIHELAKTFGLKEKTIYSRISNYKKV